MSRLVTGPRAALLWASAGCLAGLAALTIWVAGDPPAPATDA